LQHETNKQKHSHTKLTHMMEGSYFETKRAEDIAAAQRRINLIECYVDSIEKLYWEQRNLLEDIKSMSLSAFESENKDKTMQKISVYSDAVRSKHFVFQKQIDEMCEHVKQMKALFFHIK